MKIKLLDTHRKVIGTIAEVTTEAGPVGRCNVACPSCGTRPTDVRGNGRHIAEDDRAYESSAVTLCCKATIGTIRAEPATLFGLHEDEAVLTHGRARVYGG